MTTVLRAIYGRSTPVIALVTVMLTILAAGSFAKGKENLPLDIKGPVASEPWTR